MYPSFILSTVEKYFDMKKNQCKEALDIYKKFLARMTKLSEFLKVAEVSIVIPAPKGPCVALGTGTVACLLHDTN